MAIRTCEWHVAGNDALPHNYCSNPEITKGYSICSLRTEKECPVRKEVIP
jgi:hypothetical protein